MKQNTDPKITALHGSQMLGTLLRKMIYCVSGSRTRLFCLTENSLKSVVDDDQYAVAFALKDGQQYGFDYGKIFPLDENLLGKTISKFSPASWDHLLSIYKKSVDNKKNKPFSKAIVRKYLLENGWDFEVFEVLDKLEIDKLEIDKLEIDKLEIEQTKLEPIAVKKVKEVVNISVTVGEKIRFKQFHSVLEGTVIEIKNKDKGLIKVQTSEKTTLIKVDQILA